jgi:hypothetical protein
MDQATTWTSRGAARIVDREGGLKLAREPEWDGRLRM